MDKTKPQVHFVVETGSISGGVRVIGELCNRLTLRGWSVSIWSINPRETMTKWFPLDKRVIWNDFQRTDSSEDYEQLAEVLKRQTGLKIATYWKTAWAVQFASAPGEGMYLVQDIEVVYAIGPILQAKILETYGLGLRCLATSRWVEKQLKASDYIGIGLDARAFRPPKGNVRSDYALACARRQVFKGWVELAEVAHYLAEAGNPLVTYGMDRELALLCRHKHIPFPSDEILRKMLWEAACFISTSRHEGFSLTPLEAMAAGCPVVMSSADGNLEYAQHGVNCIIAETPEAIASEVIDLLREKEKGAQFLKAGLETAARYTWTAVIDRLEAALLSEPAKLEQEITNDIPITANADGAAQAASG